MKKIIAVVIAFSVLISALAVSAEAPCFYDIYTGGEDALFILDELSLLPEGEFDAESITTRGEFCAMLAKAVDLQSTSDVEYKDVPSDYWASDAIGAVSGAGLIKPVGNGYFFPEEPMAVKDMMSAVSAIVYDGEYLSRLKSPDKLRITDGLNMGKTAFTNEETATLIWQMLKSQTYRISEVSEKGYAVKELSENSLLSEIHSIYETEGVLDDVAYRAEQNTASLNGVVYNYDYDLSYIRFMLGKRVVAYTLERVGDKKILYVCEDTEEGETIKALSEDVLFEKGSITYFDGNKKRTKKVSKNPSVYINGELQTSYTWKNLNFDCGWTELTDNNNDKVIDVVLQYRPENAIVSTVNTGKKVIDDFNGKNTLDLSDSAVSYSVFDKDGKVLKLSELKKWDVLSIFADSDKKDFVIIRSSDNVSGFVDGLSEDSCSINGVWYKIDSAYHTSEDYLLKLGMEGSFYIDFLGNIVSAKVMTLENNYGILMGIAQEKGLEPALSVKLFSEDGSVKIIESAKSFKIDGTKEYVEKNAYSTLCTYDNYQLVRYKVNNLGLLTEIEFAKTSDRPEVSYDPSRFTLNYKGSTKLYFDVIGPGYKADSNTRVFVIPPDKTDERSYQIGDKNLLPTDYTTISFYDCGEDYFIDIAVLEYEGGKGAGDTMYGQNIAVFEGMSRGINRSEEIVPVIKYMQMGQKGSVTAKSNGIRSLDSRTWSEYSGMLLENLKPGDVFQFTTDSFGELDDFHVIHRASETTYKERGTTTPTKDFMVGMLSTCYGQVLFKNSEAIIVNGNGMGAVTDHGWDRIYRTAGLSVMIVEYSGDDVVITKGGKEDIRKDDTVLVRVTNGAAKELVIYRKDV